MSRKRVRQFESLPDVLELFHHFRFEVGDPVTHAGDVFGERGDFFVCRSSTLGDEHRKRIQRRLLSHPCSISRRLPIPR
jgi:hypothetical protein